MLAPPDARSSLHLTLALTGGAAGLCADNCGGAAYIAGLARGVYPDPGAIDAAWRPQRCFAPQMTAAERKAGWRLPCRSIRDGTTMNVLFPLPDARAAECADTFLTRSGLRIERIVSHGQASPPGFWYDQAEGEWVLLLAGAARLRFADEAQARLLGPGDCVDIAPHRRHRVDWTDPAAATVWLAVFYR